jgi:hypothetical protein
MAEHDEELDRRITALLALAQQDAPAPQKAILPAPRRTGRILAIAASVVLIGVAGVALVARGRSDHPSAATTASSVDITSTPSQSSTDPSTTVADERNCSAPAVDSYDTVGSMHTIVPSAQALDIAIVALDGPWCPGGSGFVRVTATNVGTSQERLIPLQLILNGGMNKYPLSLANLTGEYGGMSVAPGSSITIEVHVSLPAVPPGAYLLQVYGFDSSADVNVAGPTACASTDLSAAVGPSDNGPHHQTTPLTVTNVGAAPCFLGKPLIVMGVGSDGIPATQIPLREGFDSVEDPRPSRVLQPSEATSIVVRTVDGCLDSTHPAVYWSGLQLVMDRVGSSAIQVTGRFQTACGVSLTGWARPIG